MLIPPRGKNERSRLRFVNFVKVQHEEQTRETRIKQEQLVDASIQASWQKIAVTSLNGQSAVVWKDKIYRRSTGLVLLSNKKSQCIVINP